MRRIDLGGTLGQCTGGLVSERLAVRIGLSPPMVAHVLARTADVLVAALAAAVAEGPGAAMRVFDTLLSPDCDAHIGSVCAQRVSTTVAMKELGDAGDALLVQATGRHVASLSDHVAARCGVPPQAAHALGCIAAAIVAGLLKHHILLGQGQPAQLPGLLASQIPLVADTLSDGLAVELGYGTASAFMATVPPRLAAVAADFPGPPATPAGPPAMTAHVPSPQPAPDGGQGEPAAGRQTLFPVRTDYTGPQRYAGLTLHRHQGVHRARPVTPAPASVARQAPPASSPGTPTAPVAKPPARSIAPWLLFFVAATALTALFAWSRVHPGSGDAPARAASATPGNAPPAPAVPASAMRPPAAPVTAPATATPPPAAASAAPPAVSAISGGWLDGRSDATGRPEIAALVGDPTQRATLDSAVSARFGDGHLTASIAPAAATGSPPWLAHLDALLPVLAVPHAELAVRGTQVGLGGLSPQQAGAWRDRLQQALGPPFTVEVSDPAAAQARATDAYLLAMAALLETDRPCTVQAVVPVLNLQPIDFAPSSGHVPAPAQQNLSETAQLLRACAARGQPLHLSVDAWTDRRGDLDANLALSQKRADAVRAFLVGAGVPAGTLAAHGHGAADPVAGDLTAAGRLANRRIRFNPVQP
ncbi:OmpA family protein [Paraburkholderia kururiensis]|uniref:OmpA family protein n=1 Tax=Paraburkholderia kururiensis TaxID=984307 RepID=UPI000F88F518|nr:OmpA family protein [Paraburkholderia kururiensis]